MPEVFYALKLPGTLGRIVQYADILYAHTNIYIQQYITITLY